MKKFLKIFIISALASVLLLVALSLWFLSAIFDREAMPLPPMGFKQETILSLMPKMQELTLRVFSAKPEDIDTITLNAEEVNSLFFMALNAEKVSSLESLLMMETANAMPQDAEFSISYKDGLIHLSFARNTGVWTPFGSYINGMITGSAELTEQGQKLNIRELHVGSLSLPISFIEGSANKEVPAWLAKFLGEQKGKRPIVELRALPPNGEQVLIRYRPYQMNELLQRYLQERLEKK